MLSTLAWVKISAEPVVLSTCRNVLSS